MINKLISKRARVLESYKAESEARGIALDKNEMPWDLEDKVKEALIKSVRNMQFNRYPDSSCTGLKAAISRYTGIETASIAVGNGSDELISLILQTFIEPNDSIAVHKPTFTMYKAYGTICGAQIWEYDLDSNFEMRLEEYIGALKRKNPKLIFLCNPNNPTGRGLELSEIEQVLKAAGGIVVVDEAYFEFSGITAAGLLSSYDNLIILRTFSKAFGLAGLRVGYMLACPSIVNVIDRVRSPYNVNSFAQAAAETVLENIGAVKERIGIVKGERERLSMLLSKLEDIQCFESRSNFILIRTSYAGDIYGRLKEAGTIIRRFSDPVLKDCLRITIGSPEENMQLYKVIKEVMYEGV